LNIIVMGTGGIGGYYGGRLAAAGSDVFFVARGAHLAAMRESGLWIKSVRGDAHVWPVRAGEDPKEAGTADVVLLCTKAWDVEKAAAAIAPAVGDETVVVPLQNGIDIRDRVGRHVDVARVAGGAAYGVVNLAAPGVVEHSTHVHRLIFGGYGPEHPRNLRRFHEACRASGFEAVLSDDIERVLWEKFVFICAYSGMTSLLRTPIGAILDDDRSRRMFHECMREIQALARAMGVELDDEVIERQMAFARSLEPTATSSMQRDLVQGHPLEIGTLNGTVSRLARAKGVATPINDRIATSLQPWASGAPASEAYASMW
jgi:2-dehydropantoate 2-reductase